MSSYAREQEDQYVSDKQLLDAYLETRDVENDGKEEDPTSQDRSKVSLQIISVTASHMMNGWTNLITRWEASIVASID
jgi:hypothetical protein